MYLDKQNLVSDQQAVTVTAVTTNAIDLGVAGTIPGLGGTPLMDAGRGEEPVLLAQVTETFTAAGAATLTVEIITATDAALTAGIVSHQSTPALAKTDLVAGYQFRLRIPAGLPATGRYLGLRFTVATGPMTAGKVTAGIVSDKQTNPFVG